jgi:tetratricopeptide (TPR) repeat protein
MLARFFRPSLIIVLLYVHSAAHSFIFGQDKKEDSLRMQLLHSPEDTGKVNTLFQLADHFKFSNMDSAIAIELRTLKLAVKLKWKRGMARAERNLGVFYRLSGNFGGALEQYALAICHFRELKDSAGVAKVLGNIGAVHLEKGEYPKALDYFLRSLKMGEQQRSDVVIGNSLGNIGMVYDLQGDYPNSIAYQLKTIALAERTGNHTLQYNTLANMGTTYAKQGDFVKGLECELRAAELSKKSGDSKIESTSLGNIGLIYSLMNDEKNALKYQLQALAIDEKRKDPLGISRSNCNVGSILVRMGEYKRAADYLEKSIVISSGMGYQEGKKIALELLSISYEKQGSWKEALRYYKEFISLRDSIYNEDNTKKSVQLQMNYEFSKQQTADSIRNAEQLRQEELVHEQEIGQQKIYTYGGALGFVLMLLVALISFRAFRQKQKANAIISEQKALVEEKQKEILDSIYYARRIQRSQLPTEKYITRSLERLHTQKKS